MHDHLQHVALGLVTMSRASGAGMGFRDSNQDLLGFVHMVPERARQRILDLAATQLPTGGAYHQYQPLTKRGNNDVGGNFNDDPLWLVLGRGGLYQGNRRLVDPGRAGPYDNQPGSETPLYEHLQRSLRYTLDRLGPHGLPLIGRADWNDCLNLNCFSDTPGQSSRPPPTKTARWPSRSLSAGCLCWRPKRWPGWPTCCGDHAEAQQAACRPWQTDGAAVWAHGWDGDWFRRAYDDFGQPVGSRECEEGQIFIEPQGICVMAGIGLDGRQGQRRPWIRWASAWPRRTASSCSSRPIRSTTCTWVRSPPTRPATKRTPASSATPTRGS